MRLVTWNVNSIRVRLDNLARVIKTARPDVICLQETKASDADFPLDAMRRLGFPFIATRGEKGYNGVAVCSRHPFEDEQRLAWWGKSDSRHLSVRLRDAFELHVFYVPSGGPTPDPAKNEKFAHKLGFLAEMAGWAADARASERRIAIVGDLNVAPLENDVWNHKRIRRQVGHTPVECERMAALQAAGGFTDVGRHYVPPDRFLFTWWGYRHPQAYARNYGWRLDHVWVTPPLAPHLAGHAVLDEARTWPRPSDHVPVVVDLR